MISIDPKRWGKANVLDSKPKQKSSLDEVTKLKRRADVIQNTGQDPLGNKTLEEVLQQLEKKGVNYDPTKPAMDLFPKAKGKDLSESLDQGTKTERLVNAGLIVLLIALFFRLID